MIPYCWRGRGAKKDRDRERDRRKKERYNERKKKKGEVYESIAKHKYMVIDYNSLRLFPENSLYIASMSDNVCETKSNEI